jgi:hypothetical protein
MERSNLPLSLNLEQCEKSPEDIQEVENAGECQVFKQKKTRKIMDLKHPRPCFKIPLYEFELFI